MSEWTAQEAFEAGVGIGLRAAESMLMDGGGIKSVRGYIAQMDDVKRRRDMEKRGCREVVDGDIFLSQPVAHPGDFGLPSTATDDFASSFGRPNA